jgi:hypothetical protein
MSNTVFKQMFWNYAGSLALRRRESAHSYFKKTSQLRFPEPFSCGVTTFCGIVQKVRFYCFLSACN